MAAGPTEYRWTPANLLSLEMWSEEKAAQVRTWSEEKQSVEQVEPTRDAVKDRPHHRVPREPREHPGDPAADSPETPAPAVAAMRAGTLDIAAAILAPHHRILG
jgi:hypothetical protein